MSDLLSLWWVWIAASITLGIIEVLAPGFIFLGFALGALVMAAVVVLLPGLSVPAILAIFGALSLISWIGLRRAFKRQSSATKVITRDVNDH